MVPPIIDMQAPSNWGFLRWVQSDLGDTNQADIQVRTRAGTDTTPLS